VFAPSHRGLVQPVSKLGSIVIIISSSCNDPCVLWRLLSLETLGEWWAFVEEAARPSPNPASHFRDHHLPGRPFPFGAVIAGLGEACWNRRDGSVTSTCPCPYPLASPRWDFCEAYEAILITDTCPLSVSGATHTPARIQSSNRVVAGLERPHSLPAHFRAHPCRLEEAKARFVSMTSPSRCSGTARREPNFEYSPPKCRALYQHHLESARPKPTLRRRFMSVSSPSRRLGAMQGAEPRHPEEQNLPDDCKRPLTSIQVSKTSWSQLVGAMWMCAIPKVFAFWAFGFSQHTRRGVEKADSSRLACRASIPVWYLPMSWPWLVPRPGSRPTIPRLCPWLVRAVQP
jgi:hypothetical protein